MANFELDNVKTQKACDTTKDFNYIKSHYGEKFAKLCRELFPNIFEHKKELPEFLIKHFDNIPTLYDDILLSKEDFRDFVFSSLNFTQKTNLVKTDKSPEQLMDEAGYYLFPECKKERDLKKFKKYYDSKDMLCTFYSKRLQTCRVWFAVKKELLDDIDAIKKEYPPKRQDAYGTSVISIQFTKGKVNYLSIKNRYNHSVKDQNPDCTYNNNLDNIVLGLTYAFCKHKGLNISKIEDDTPTPFCDNMKRKNYIMDKNGKFYKIKKYLSKGKLCFNNNIITDDNSIIHFDKSNFVIFDTYILSLKHKKIIDLNKLQFFDNETVNNIFNFLSKNEDTNDKLTDAFIQSIGNINKLKISYNKDKNKVITLTPENGEDVIIVLDKFDNIIKYSNPNIFEIKNNFLTENKHIQEIYLPNAMVIGNNFLTNCECVQKYDFQSVEVIGNKFLSNCKNLQSICLPKAKIIGNEFLYNAQNLTNIDLPCVTTIGDEFNYRNCCILSITLPKVENIGNKFLGENNSLNFVNLPQVKQIGNNFLVMNNSLKEINIPKIENVGTDFLISHHKKKKVLKNTKLKEKKKIIDIFLPF